jgi:hypothetical protein
VSPEETLFYIGFAAYLLPPAVILALVARARRRSIGFAACAVLGWVGLAIGLALLLSLPARTPPVRPLR